MCSLNWAYSPNDWTKFHNFDWLRFRKDYSTKLYFENNQKLSFQIIKKNAHVLYLGPVFGPFWLFFDLKQAHNKELALMLFISIKVCLYRVKWFIKLTRDRERSFTFSLNKIIKTTRLCYKTLSIKNRVE